MTITINKFHGILFTTLVGILALASSHLRQPSYPAAPAVAGTEIEVVDADNNLKNLGIKLPTVSKPVANYVHVVRTGNLLFLSGKGPAQPDGTYVTGKVGKDLTIQQGADAARLAAISQLAVLKRELGSLNRVTRVVKVLGMVNATEEFTDHSKVMNGYSDLMVEVFGDRGRHARAAVGMQSLPKNFAVEVEMIVEIAE